MRSIIRLSLLLLVAAGIAPFFITGKDGRPLLSLSRLNAPSLPQVSLPAWNKPEGDDRASAPVTLYRWRDERGIWQFSDNPPPPGVAYETVAVDPDVNLLDSRGSTPPGDASASQAAQEPSASSGLPLPLTVSPDGIKKIMGQARGVEALTKERKAAQDRALDGAR